MTARLSPPQAQALRSAATTGALFRWPGGLWSVREWNGEAGPPPNRLIRYETLLALIAADLLSVRQRLANRIPCHLVLTDKGRAAVADLPDDPPAAPIKDSFR